MKLSRSAIALCATAALLAGCGGSDSSESSDAGGGGASEVRRRRHLHHGAHGRPGKPRPAVGRGQRRCSRSTSSPTTRWSASNAEYRRHRVPAGDRLDGRRHHGDASRSPTASPAPTAASFTATTVADNIAFVGDPKNQSPFLGTFLPVGATAKADDAAGTVTLKLAAPAPFVLNGLASLPMVCQARHRRPQVAGRRRTAGTGPYELTEAVPGDQYTYQIRDGYTWGPNGATTASEGMPATVVMKIVQNETTSANLLLSGDINAGAILGPDVERLDAAGPVLRRDPGAAGRAVVQPRRRPRDQRPGRPDGADPGARPRRARDGARPPGTGTPATTLAAIEPIACPGDSVSGSLPATDADAAKAVLARPAAS